MPAGSRGGVPVPLGAAGGSPSLAGARRNVRFGQHSCRSASGGGDQRCAGQAPNMLLSLRTQDWIAEIASRTGADVTVLRSRFTDHDGPDKLERILRVTNGLERLLGGSDAFHRWATTPLPAFGGRRPVDVIEEGRVTPLERAYRSINAGVFS